MFAAAHDLVKGKTEVEDHAEHFHISSTSIPCQNAYKILSRLKKPLSEVHACSVGKFVQLQLI